MWVDNEAGVLARIAGLFSRGYNIESLVAAEVEGVHISRITIVTEGRPKLLNRLNYILEKLSASTG